MRCFSATGLGVVLLVAMALGSGAQAAPRVGPCLVFPDNNIWNARVDDLAVDLRSDAYVEAIGADEPLWRDFGSGLYEDRPIGIPFVIVPFQQPKVDVHFEPFFDEAAVPDESDPGPYPIPPDAPIEGGLTSEDDRHVIVVQEGSCTLFELYKAVPNDDGSWSAVSAAKFDLEGNELRPEGWTSADAAGLPIFPGLVRYEEIEAGEIKHAIRFTAPVTRRAFVWPARHFAADSEDPNLPAMGQRFRLKADVDISGFSRTNQIILTALKTYGMILADNGSPWFITGAPNEGWDNDDLALLAQIKGSDFEAVDVSPLLGSINSGEVGARETTNTEFREVPRPGGAGAPPPN